MGFENFEKKAIIGVVHLKPLPGEPLNTCSLEEILERALEDARSLESGGVDALIVENFGDAPFLKAVEPHTIAFMTYIASEIKKEVSIPIGINVLRNDAKAALAIATAIRADFIRVNVHVGVYVAPEGILEGKAHETLRYRKILKSNVKIFADVHVKHAYPLGFSIEEIAVEAVERGLADAVVVTGKRTGEETSLNDLKKVKDAVNVPVLAGSGLNADNIEKILKIADGAIVGTFFKNKRGEIDVNKVKILVKKAKKIKSKK